MPSGNSLVETPNLSSSWSHSLDKNTVTVYRVEGDANTRILLDGSGNLSITGNQMLFLNFGDPIRAQEFLSKRLIQGMEGATVKQFEVPQSVLSDLRKNAVKETEVKNYPNNPIVVDKSKGNDQYGIRGDKFKELQDQIK